MTSSWLCPVPAAHLPDRISLAHGEGARLSRQLLQEFILPLLSGGNPQDNSPPPVCDAAMLSTAGPIAFCTDAHTVTPLHFPGGDLGSLAVIGTVNDLAVAGAVPRWLSLSLIIEEGFPTAELGALLESAGRTARECGVTIVAGDTKVLPRGAVDGVLMVTSGIGEFKLSPPPGPREIREGDRVIISGDIGRHGVAVLTARGLLQSSVLSDCGSLVSSTADLRAQLNTHLRCLRDCTRGGLAAVLHEWAVETPLAFELTESQIPVGPAVRGACELLGLEPVHLPNEGTFAAVVAADAADAAIAVLQKFPQHANAAIIGTVTRRSLSPVLVARGPGRPRPLDDPAGAPLPRIC
jgi:hydrogenase expression/formation protein HypE